VAVAEFENLNFTLLWEEFMKSLARLPNSELPMPSKAPRKAYTFRAGSSSHQEIEPKMTIAAGFRYQNGVLLTTDTQHTYLGMMKLSRPKLVRLDFLQQGARIGIAIAGDVSFATMAAEDIAAAIPKTDFSPEAIKSVIRDVVLGTYERHIHPFNKTEYNFDLLCALWTTAGGVELYQTNETSVTAIKDYGLIGLGLYLAQYLSESYYPQSKTKDEAFVFAVDVLRKVKDHVDGCGGNTDLLWMEDDGKWGRITNLDVNDTEEFSKEFSEISEELLRVASDLSLEEPEIDDYLELVAEEIHGLRGTLRSRVERTRQMLSRTPLGQKKREED
jgi:20S proteasome alpha/beta subunit